MKYCLKYSSASSYMKEIDEIIIDYNNKEANFLNFLQNHKGQKVHMSVSSSKLRDFFSEEIKILSEIKKNYPELDFEVRLPFEDETLGYLEELKKNKIPFWFYSYVNDWDVLNYYLSLGVSQITLVENLCFEIDKAAALIHDAGARVRVIPNIAQSHARAYTPGIRKFFIRPEDIVFYGKYVDVCDIFYYKSNEGDTYYKIYAKDQQWYGDLKEIIIDLNESADSRGFLPTFAIKRISCGKKCMKGSKCRICECYKNLSKTLLKNNLIINKD